MTASYCTNNNGLLLFIDLFAYLLIFIHTYLISVLAASHTSYWLFSACFSVFYRSSQHVSSEYFLLLCSNQNRLRCRHGGGEPLPGRGQGVQRGRRVPAAAHRVRVGLHQGLVTLGPLQQAQVPQGAAALLRPRARRVHPPAALLPVQRHGLLGAPAPDRGARLLLRGRGEAQLPDSDEGLQR